jgi:hypothetical protein
MVRHAGVIVPLVPSHCFVLQCTSPHLCPPGHHARPDPRHCALQPSHPTKPTVAQLSQHAGACVGLVCGSKGTAARYVRCFRACIPSKTRMCAAHFLEPRKNGEGHPAGSRQSVVAHPRAPQSLHDKHPLTVMEVNFLGQVCWTQDEQSTGACLPLPLATYWLPAFTQAPLCTAAWGGGGRGQIGR